MPQTDVPIPNSIVFLAANKTDWADEIYIHLSALGYHLNTVTTAENAHQILQTRHCAAIITFDDSEGMTFLETVRNVNKSQHPLLVMIATNDTANINEHCFATADVVLPPKPVYITHQLQTLLRMRSENQQLTAETAYLEKRINEQRRANGEIELLKNAIVRNVSHELKTPLLQVKSAVSLIAEDAEDSTLIKYAKDATARLEMLVKNITMLGSSLDINLGPTITRDTVEYARRNLKRVWQHHGEAERVKIYLEDNLPPVLADKQGLSTVLQLLVDNALKFSDGDVEVHAYHEGDGIRIAVRDYGIGIAKDQLESVFDSFYQVDRSSTRPYGGTGVGLALVKLILDYHNVKIDVESQEGLGSTFSFKLPIVKF